MKGSKFRLRYQNPEPSSKVGNDTSLEHILLPRNFTDGNVFHEEGVAQVNTSNTELLSELSDTFTEEHSTEFTREITNELPQYALNVSIIRAFPNQIDEQVVNIEIDNREKYTLQRCSQRWHCWELFDIEGNKVARLRACRGFSWIQMVDSNGNTKKVSKRMSFGTSRLEWRVKPYELLRWSKYNHKMLAVENDIVQFPELASLTMYSLPKSLQTNQGIDFSVQWRKPALYDIQLEYTVICMAFISMWKWSREIWIMEDLGSSIGRPVLSWLVHNLNLDQFQQILPTTRGRRFINTYSEWN